MAHGGDVATEQPGHLTGRRRLLLVALAIALTLAGSIATLRGSMESAARNELLSTLPGAHWLGEFGGVPPSLVTRRFDRPAAATARAWLADSWHFVATTRSGEVSVFTKPGRTLYLATAKDSGVLSLQRAGGCGSREASFPEPAPDDWLQFGAAPSEVVEALEGRWPDLVFADCVDRGHWTVTSEPVPRPAGTIASARFITPVAPVRAILMSARVFVTGPGERVDLGLGAVAIFDRSPSGGELRWTADDLQHREVILLGGTGSAEGMRRLVYTACRTYRPVLC